MKRSLLLLCSKMLPNKKWRRAVRKEAKLRDSVLCFAQEGEDQVLKRIFENQKTGFYVDVGAHHPFRFSNTALFCQRGGWTGINIDPLPGTKKLFDKYRGNDVNLELGVATNRGVLTYHMFNEPALNTFDVNVANSRDGGVYKIVGTKNVSVLPLADILDRYLPKSQMIDFLTIDAEGLDFEILKSNDWERYSPRIVIIEALNCQTVEDVLITPSVLFLKGFGYRVIAKTGNSIFLEKY